MTWKINVALLIAVLELTLWTFSAKRSASIRDVLMLKSALMTSAIRGATQDTTENRGASRSYSKMPGHSKSTALKKVIRAWQARSPLNC
jgi:hypothetical protein